MWGDNPHGLAASQLVRQRKLPVSCLPSGAPLPIMHGTYHTMEFIKYWLVANAMTYVTTIAVTKAFDGAYNKLDVSRVIHLGDSSEQVAFVLCCDWLRGSGAGGVDFHSSKQLIVAAGNSVVCGCSKLVEIPGITVSIDTFNAEVAEAAVAAGAHIINDVMAGRGDPNMFATVCPAVQQSHTCMHT